MNSEINVVKPETVILTTEERYVKDEITVMVLNDGISFNSGSSFVIKDINKVEYFKCKDKSVLFTDGKVLKDMNKVPVIAIKGNSHIYNPNKNKKIASVSKNGLFSSSVGYDVSFHNKATHSNENLVMKYDSKKKECNIFYGKNEKAPLVAKIQKKSSVIGKD
ncbi:hypothetical protein BCR36DRAFT_582750, partial [Piromyces finnis]